MSRVGTTYATPISQYRSQAALDNGYCFIYREKVLGWWVVQKRDRVESQLRNILKGSHTFKTTIN
jgi:hypothetical protein